MDSNFVKKTINLYEGVGWKKFFTRIRFWDAPFDDIDKLVPNNGVILDLGCGEGIFTNYLALKSNQRKLIGIEIDKDRVLDANRNLKNVKFIHADALKKDLPKSDVILMTHILHHLPSKTDQERLIQKTFKSIKRGGKLIITEVSERPFLKYVVSWLTDAFIVPVLFEKKLYNFNFYYRTQDEWFTLLKKHGLKVRSYKASKDKPFSHIIFECVKE